RLEKATRRLWLAERNERGRSADLAPLAGRARVVDAAEGGIVGFDREHGAGTHECLNGVLWVALRPRPELAELDRVESKRRWRDRRGRRGLGRNARRPRLDRGAAGEGRSERPGDERDASDSGLQTDASPGGGATP